MEIYLEYEGIDGNIESANFEGWISCLTAQWGVGRHDTHDFQCAEDRFSKPNFTHITLTKVMDNASAGIFKEAVSGSGTSSASIHFTQDGAGSDDDNKFSFMVYELEDVSIANYSVDAESGNNDIARETITLHFSKITITPLSTWRAVTSVVGYDIQTNSLV